MTYEWEDQDGDRADVVARNRHWTTDSVALLTISEPGTDEIAAQVYINAEQAKELEAFFAGLVMSLPAGQRS